MICRDAKRLEALDDLSVQRPLCLDRPAGEGVDAHLGVAIGLTHTRRTGKSVRLVSQEPDMAVVRRDSKRDSQRAVNRVHQRELFILRVLPAYLDQDMGHALRLPALGVDRGPDRADARTVGVVSQAGMLPTDEALLDDPVYGALCGPHARLAQVRGRARRYPADVAPFLALPSPPTAQDWRDAADLVAPGSYVAGRYSAAELPDGWREVQAFDLVQMVEERVTGVDCSEAIQLGLADVPEMLELVAQTEPGPFLARTIELGDYFGIRRDGELVAMAGERFQLDGWTEISAVCTKHDFRGQGLASRLMGALIAGIKRRSQRVFLHVMSSNTGAIRLYEELGFRIRQTATLTVVTREPLGGARR